MTTGQRLVSDPNQSERYALPLRRVLRWDGDIDPDEGDMDFRLTYAGPLLAHRDDKRLEVRKLHVHDIRKAFHAQLRTLWSVHPILLKTSEAWIGPAAGTEQVFTREGFRFLPIATSRSGLICKVDVLLLRHGNPGGVMFDLDNRLKTLFDALRMPKGPQELGQGSSQGVQIPGPDEDPFYVLLEDDNLITHLAVTSDRLLEPVPDTPEETAVRVVIDVTVRPYDVHVDNLAFA